MVITRIISVSLFEAAGCGIRVFEQDQPEVRLYKPIPEEGSMLSLWYIWAWGSANLNIPTEWLGVSQGVCFSCGFDDWL